MRPRASSAAANASSVGANTVNGPAPESVSTRPASVTAATRVVKLPAPTATSTMVPGSSAIASSEVASSGGGNSTVSMMWMMPFEAATSAPMTVALLIMTLPSTTLMSIDAPLTVSADWPSRLIAVAASTSPATTW